MLLSDAEILKLAQSSALLAPFTDANVRRASYDLRVGSEYYLGRPNGTELNAAHPIAALPLVEGQSFEIPPNAICYVICKEKITLPNDISARVSLRMTLVFGGLMLAAQPPFDPGYSGMVVVMLHNLSSRPYPIKEGERLVTIEFSRLSNASTGPIRSANIATLNQSLKSRVVSSLQDIQFKLDKTQDGIQKLISQSLGLAAVVVGLPAILIIAASVVQYTYLSGKIDDQKAALEEYRESLSETRSELAKVKAGTACAVGETCQPLSSQAIQKSPKQVK